MDEIVFGTSKHSQREPRRDVVDCAVLSPARGTVTASGGAPSGARARKAYRRGVASLDRDPVRNEVGRKGQWPRPNRPRRKLGSCRLRPMLVDSTPPCTDILCKAMVLPALVCCLLCDVAHANELQFNYPTMFCLNVK